MACHFYVYYGIFGIENEVGGIYSSFTGIPLRYDLWVETVSGVVYEYYNILKQNEIDMHY